VVKLTRSMTNTIVHDEGAASFEVAVNKVKLSRSKALTSARVSL